MLNLTGRDEFPQTSVPESVPLHFRVDFYDAEQVRSYWNWLGYEGCRAEMQFLKADLVFPIMYGGALLVALFIIWIGLGRPFSPRWLVVPVGITVLADWFENLVHWHQLRRFLKEEPIQAVWIQLSSLATMTKIVFFSFSALLLVVMAIYLAINLFKTQA